MNSRGCFAKLLLAGCIIVLAPTCEAWAKSDASTATSSTNGINQVPVRSMGLSPDGSYIAYVLLHESTEKRYAEQTDGGSADLYVHNIKDGKTTKVSPSSFQPAPGGTKPVWSPDSRLLAYYGVANDRVVLKIWSSVVTRIISEGSAPICTHPDCTPSSPQWSEDGKFVYFVEDSESGLLAKKRRSEIKSSATDWMTGLPASSLFRELVGVSSSGTGMTVLTSSALQAAKSAGVQEAESVHQEIAERLLRHVMAMEVETGQERVLATGYDLSLLATSDDGSTAIVVTAHESGLSSSVYALPEHVLEEISGIFDSLPTLTAAQRGVTEDKLPCDGFGVPLNLISKSIPTSVASSIALSPSGRYLAYVGLTTQPLGDLFLQDLSTGEVRNLTESVHFSSDEESKNRFIKKFISGYDAPIWLADESAVLALHIRPNLIDRGISQETAELWRVNASGERSRSLLPKRFAIVALPTCAGRQQGACAMLPTGEVFAKVKNLDTGMVSLAAIDPNNGSMRVVGDVGASLFSGNEMPGSIAGLMRMQFSQQAEVGISLESDFYHPQDIRMFDTSLDSDGEILSLNLVNHNTNNSFTYKYISWRKADGGIGGATLLLPKGVSTNSPVPVVLWVYPGVGHARGATLKFESGRGQWEPILESGRYAVLVPELPTDDQSVGACKQIASSSERALMEAARTGLISADRAGVMGYSYGGYASLCVAANSGRFRAFVAGAGLSDLVSSAYLPGGSGGKPPPFMSTGEMVWEEPDKFISSSPIYSVDKVSAPILLIYGKDDTPLAHVQFMEMYWALMATGKKAQLVAYDGRGHASTPNHPDYWPRVIKWFDSLLAVKDERHTDRRVDSYRR